MISKNARFITLIFGAIMRGCRLTFLALGTGHVIPAQGTSCIFPVCNISRVILSFKLELFQRKVSRVLRLYPDMIISTFVLNKTDLKNCNFYNLSRTFVLLFCQNA